MSDTASMHISTEPVYVDLVNLAVPHIPLHKTGVCSSAMYVIDFQVCSCFREMSKFDLLQPAFGMLPTQQLYTNSLIPIIEYPHHGGYISLIPEELVCMVIGTMGDSE